MERIAPDRETFSAKALATFRAMHALDQFSDQWWKLHGKLFFELRLRPWEWPACERPGTQGSPANGERQHAQARYRALAAAAGIALPG